MFSIRLSVAKGGGVDRHVRTGSSYPETCHQKKPLHQDVVANKARVSMSEKGQSRERGADDADDADDVHGKDG